MRRAGSSAVAAAGAGLALPGGALAQQERRYNILLVVTDQERYLPAAQRPAGYQLPGHEKLASRGVVFENHQIASCVCTPSRAVIYTGQHIQHNRMFDNTNFPWSNDLSTELPTVGDMLRRLGYYTAYKGKWHLTKEFETANDLHRPTRVLSEEMEQYGFADYFGVGDIIAHTQGGFLHDGVIAAMMRSWLRGRAMSLREQNTPWFMALNLVNPHDVMYYNTDEPGAPVKQASTAMMALNRAPMVEQFTREWKTTLPESRRQLVSGPGRPPAHEEFAVARSALVGRVPNEDERWRRLNDYYLNCIQAVDQHLLEVLDEIDDVGMKDDTIVIYTSDHGELGGAHGLSGKGATTFREQQNVPLIISHPGFPGGRRCAAVTSHVDLATTLVSLAGGDPGALSVLPGRDISTVLADPEGAPTDAIRPSALYSYNMLAYLDGEFLMKVSQFIRDGGEPSDLPKQAFRPDLTKRGAIRSVFDGRYRFSRYFSPLDHHVPRSLEQLLAKNDVELFDLESDPHEMRNLADDPQRNGDLLVALNNKLNVLVEAEVGEDVGQMLPDDLGATWTLDPSISYLRM